MSCRHFDMADMRGALRSRPMKIEIRFRGLPPSPMLKDHAARQAAFHLARFGEELTELWLTVSDVNGPRGGLDKRCQVSARGPRIAVFLESEAEDAYRAVDEAVKRLARTVRRDLERLHSRRLQPRLVSS